MNFYRQLGARLRAFRLRKGLSQAALGARLGRTAGAINRYERGLRRVPAGDLPRLASIFGVTPGALMTGSRGAAVDRVQEEAPVYRAGRAAASTAGIDAYAASLSNARLRSFARRAGLNGRDDPESLRRYARLIAEHFARGAAGRGRRTR